MQDEFNRASIFSYRKAWPVLLSLSWLAGILIGCFFASFGHEPYDDLIFLAVQDRVSFLGILCTLLLPVMLSAAMIYLSIQPLILFISFFYAFLYSFSSSLVVRYFADAGWLVKNLLLGSRCAMSIVLIWFWIRCFSIGAQSVKRDIKLCLLVAVVFCIIDYFCISPFLASLMNHL